MPPDLSVELAPGHKRGLRLDNPVMVAAGSFGYGTEYGALVDAGRLGAVVTNGVTLGPRRGARGPRVAGTAGGLVHAGGRENPGIRAVLRDRAPVWERWAVPVILNIAGESRDDLRRLAAAATAGAPWLAALELDLSSPDLPMTSELAADPAAAALMVEAVSAETDLPLLAKLAAGPDVVEMARAVAAAGASALTVSNSLPALAHPKGAGRVLRGGLSGPAIKPLALLAVAQVAEAVDLPVAGCGGIASAADALEFLAAGASAVQVGSAIYADPLAPLKVLEGLEAFLEAGGYRSLEEWRAAVR